MQRKNKIAPELNIAYSVERVAYNKNKNVFLAFLSAIPACRASLGAGRRYPCLPRFAWRRQALNAKTGFTFIEMLIVAMTFSVISLALYASLSNGIRIWQRIYNEQAAEEEVAIFMDRFAHDLRNTGSFQMIDFLGEKDALTFQTIVNSPQLQKTTVGKVSYNFNQQTATLDRKEADFSRVCEGKPGIMTHSLRNMQSGTFQYYYYSKEDKEYLWLDEAGNDIPLAVRMKMEYLDGEKNETFVKTVAIPVSG